MLVSSDFAKHDCTRRQFPIFVFDLILEEFVIRFVIRFVKQDVRATALNYLAGQPPDARASYRESLPEKEVPLDYLNQDIVARDRYPENGWRMDGESPVWKTADENGRRERWTI